MIENSTLNDFKRAFAKLKPTVTINNNRVNIKQKGTNVSICLSPKSYQSNGYTR